MVLDDRPNLIGRSREYKERLGLGYRLPKQLQDLAHSIPWPIALQTPHFHLCGYFGEIPYSDPLAEDWSHDAVDIQVPMGTPVLTPERGNVLFLNNDVGRNLVDVYVWGERSRIVYSFCHLDPSSLPEEIKSLKEFDATGLLVEQNGLIGHVGRWPFQLTQKVRIPDDVRQIYGTDFDHLHFRTSYHPKDLAKKSLGDFRRDFDPLLILNRL